MFQLSSRQFDALGAASRARFSDGVKQLVAALRPDLQPRMTPQAHEAFVRQLVDTGQRYGLTTEFECAALGAAILLAGPGFLNAPDSPLHQIIGRTQVDPVYRANQLVQELERTHLASPKVGGAAGARNTESGPSAAASHG
ncbi:hypothetical protein [Ramlibacter sp.]|uniref:hypothetical protein n=1 Tax=Ramlibacter sp. TaxID=1917967 RepID=UPI002D6E8F8B|nr:hypothetical protein [Ramlibacter sp.]HYD76636.1 hypothetical protein [Ramlibacter sp.]